MRAQLLAALTLRAAAADPVTHNPHSHASSYHATWAKSDYFLEAEKDGGRVVDARPRTVLTRNTTTYQLTSIDLPKDCLAPRSCYVVRIEPLFESQSLVHHMEVMLPLHPPTCRGKMGQYLSGWAPGKRYIYEAPADASWDVSGTGCLFMQVHYHNPSHVSRAADRTGIRLHIARRPRQFDQRLAKLSVDQIRIPPGMARFHVTQTWSLHVDPTIRVDKIGSHAHMLGREMYQTVYSDGSAHALITEPRWSFHHQHHATPLEPFRRGNNEHVLQLSCVFDSRDRKWKTQFGFSSRDEMCISYVYYSAPATTRNLWFKWRHHWSGELAAGDDARAVIGGPEPRESR